MNFLELNELYKKSIDITRANINDKLYEIPVQHGIFSKWLYLWKKKYLKELKDLEHLERKKYYHYKDDFDRALNDKEIKWHVETDSEYVEQNLKVRIFKSEVEQIEAMLKHIGNLSFFAQNIIQWEEFMAGK